MGSDLTRALHKVLSPLRRRMALLLTRAVGRMSDSSTPLQTLQIEILKDEVLDGVEHLEPYGFTARPIDGYEALTGSLNGDRGHTVVIVAADRRYRLKNLANGEAALYDDQGQVVHLKRDGIVIDTPHKVDITAGGDVNVTATGNAVVTAAEIRLNGIAGQVVTTAHVCAYTGNPHPAGSSKVKAGL